MIITQGLLPATFIIIMQKIINSLQKGVHEFDEIMFLLIIYIILNIANTTITLSYSYYKNRFMRKFSKHMNLIMLKRATELSLKQYEDVETYNIINRAQGQSGVDLIVYISNISEVIKQIITISSTVVILVNFRWWIVGLVLIIPIIRYLLTVFIDRKWYRLRVSRTAEERKSWYINFLIMTGRAFKEIRVLGIAQYLIAKYAKISEEIITQDLKMEKYNIFLQ